MSTYSTYQKYVCLIDMSCSPFGFLPKFEFSDCTTETDKKVENERVSEHVITLQQMPHFPPSCGENKLKVKALKHTLLYDTSD